MLLLLTNDDGYQAAGLAALRRHLERLGRVLVVAPAGEMSGVSHALTLNRPLSVERIDEDVYAVDGTPTDCVNIAVNRLLGATPDACISGINHGQNLGDDVSYSGTVGAAYEATLFGIPSLAVSQVRGGPHSHFEHAATIATAVAALLVRRELTLAPGTFLNLNVPDVRPQGVSATRLARRRYHEAVEPRTENPGRSFFWVGGRAVWQSLPGTDHHAVATLQHASLSLLGTDLSLALPQEGSEPEGGGVLSPALSALLVPVGQVVRDLVEQAPGP